MRRKVINIKTPNIETLDDLKPGFSFFCGKLSASKKKSKEIEIQTYHSGSSSKK